MKVYYTGDVKYLISKGYELEAEYDQRYYEKTIRSKITRKTLTCFINAKTMEIGYAGDRTLKKYFDAELKGFEVIEMKMDELQKRLDFKKYLASEQAGEDMCGKLGYCIHCNKNNKYPCASAYNKFHRGGKKNEKGNNEKSLD